MTTHYSDCLRCLRFMSKDIKDDDIVPDMVALSVCASTNFSFIFSPSTHASHVKTNTNLTVLWRLIAFKTSSRRKQNQFLLSIQPALTLQSLAQSPNFFVFNFLCSHRCVICPRRLWRNYKRDADHCSIFFFSIHISFLLDTYEKQ